MKEVVGDGVWKMERHTIELSTDELLLIARITGIMLGLAVPDKYCDCRLVLGVFNRAQEKLLEPLTATGAHGSGNCGKEAIPSPGPSRRCCVAQSPINAILSETDPCLAELP